MKKLLVIIPCLILTALCFWIFWPEYGSGYSEEQRRLWNEKRSLYPPVSLMNKGISNNFRDSFFLFSGLDGEKAEILLEKKEERETHLNNILKTLHDAQAPDFECQSFPIQQPRQEILESLSYHELKHLAEKGNANASYLAISRTPFYSQYGLAGMPWEGVQATKTLLARAVKEKRAGAEFLSQLIPNLQRQFSDQKIETSLISPCFNSDPIQLPRLENIPGFNDFRSALGKSDYEAYHVLETLLPEDSKHEAAQLLYDTLKQQADQGDIAAMRKLAQLHFGTYLHYAALSYNPEEEVNTKINRFLDKWIHLSNSSELHPKIKLWLIKFGIFSPEDSQTWVRYRTASDYAYKAARHNDLTAMYLWLRLGIITKNHFSREEWENIFTFTRRLLEASYFPFIESMDIKHEDTAPFYCSILKTFYSTKSYDKFQELCAQTVKSRNRQDKIQGILYIYSNGISRILTNRLSKKESKTFDELTEESHRGNPEAMLALARLYARGKGVPKIPEKAYILLNQSLEESCKYPLWYIDVNDHELGELPFRDVIILDILTLVLDNKDFPGRDEQKAFELTLSLKEKLPGTYSGPAYCYIYYVFGRIHEEGIGTPPDRKEALRYYKMSSKNCPEGAAKYETLSQQDQQN